MLNKNVEKKKVLLGMSGGVDSSVSAIMLQKAGYEVIGVTMMLWEGCSSSVAEDARKVCEKLGIEHHVLHYEDDFKTHVINNFISCYECAITPNPCIECNKYLKFGVLYEKAKELGCEYIATGHYAKVEWNQEYKQYVLTKSKADKKDQSYFLYQISAEVLPKIIFPLEDFDDKTEIRKIAEENNLIVAKKKDSQEICFIPDNNYVNFLENNGVKNVKTGNIVLKNGIVLGKHKGLIHYTVGQRKGLGIAYEKPLYVLELDKEKNEVIVGTEEELYENTLYANELNFLINDIDLSNKIEITAKVRYRSQSAKATLEIIQNENNEKIAKVLFEEAQRAITPGQSVVFYLGDIVLGGGKICH